MNNVQQQLFGTQSFLAVTLDHRPIVGKPSAVLSNNVRVELWDNGVLYFHPQDETLQNSLLLSVGVHGNETAPIEIINQLVNDILAGKIMVKQNLLIVIANPEAINAECREVDENMNRLFSDDSMPKSSDSNERHRSRRLMEYSQTFFAAEAAQKIHYDLHTAIRGSFYKKFAISPNTVEVPATEYQYNVLGQWGIQAILSTQQKSPTYSAFTANACGATSFTVELGQVKPFGENDLDEFSSVIDGLVAAISDDEDTSPTNTAVKRFSVAVEVVKKTEHFRLCFPIDTVNFTEFKIDQVLATDEDYQYIVANSGERILFPNENVAIGQRALVIIRPEDNAKASIL